LHCLDTVSGEGAMIPASFFFEDGRGVGSALWVMSRPRGEGEPSMSRCSSADSAVSLVWNCTAHSRSWGCGNFVTFFKYSFHSPSFGVMCPKSKNVCEMACSSMAALATPSRLENTSSS
jgi:hypothetical protein